MNEKVPVLAKGDLDTYGVSFFTGTIGGGGISGLVSGGSTLAFALALFLAFGGASGSPAWVILQNTYLNGDFC